MNFFGEKMLTKLDITFEKGRERAVHMNDIFWDMFGNL